MFDPHYLSKTIKAYRSFLEPIYHDYHLNKIELDILLFLSRFPQYDTAADIVKRRMLAKSNVSTAVNTLYQKGLINKVHRDQNKKTIHLVLLPESDDVVNAGQKAQHLFIDTLKDGLTIEEMIYFETITSKMMQNVDRIIEEEKNV